MAAPRTIDFSPQLLLKPIHEEQIKQLRYILPRWVTVQFYATDQGMALFRFQFGVNSVSSQNVKLKIKELIKELLKNIKGETSEVGIAFNRPFEVGIIVRSEQGLANVKEFAAQVSLVFQNTSEAKEAKELFANSEYAQIIHRDRMMFGLLGQQFKQDLFFTCPPNTRILDLENKEVGVTPADSFFRASPKTDVFVFISTNDNRRNRVTEDLQKFYGTEAVGKCDNFFNSKGGARGRSILKSAVYKFISPLLSLKYEDLSLEEKKATVDQAVTKFLTQICWRAGDEKQVNFEARSPNSFENLSFFDFSNTVKELKESCYLFLNPDSSKRSVVENILIDYFGKENLGKASLEAPDGSLIQGRYVRREAVIAFLGNMLSKTAELTIDRIQALGYYPNQLQAVANFLNEFHAPNVQVNSGAGPHATHFQCTWLCFMDKIVCQRPLDEKESQQFKAALEVCSSEAEKAGLNNDLTKRLANSLQIYGASFSISPSVLDEIYLLQNRYNQREYTTAAASAAFSQLAPRLPPRVAGYIGAFLQTPDIPSLVVNKVTAERVRATKNVAERKHVSRGAEASFTLFEPSKEVKLNPLNMAEKQEIVDFLNNLYGGTSWVISDLDKQISFTNFSGNIADVMKRENDKITGLMGQSQIQKVVEIIMEHVRSNTPDLRIDNVKACYTLLDVIRDYKKHNLKMS